MAGPGGGISPFLRQMHDPQAYRIVLFDQRGCGQSTPHAELEENTTWDLVADMETLRRHLGIARWQVVGGSWGSTLALAYAETHPERVTELIVRGIFTLRKSEIRWFYQQGADALFPDAWEGFLAPIPADERHDSVAPITAASPGPIRPSSSPARAPGASGRARPSRCCRTRSASRNSARTASPSPSPASNATISSMAASSAQDGQLLAEAHRLKAIPGVIIQGRYDVVTPPMTAWDLHKAWPEAEFIMVPDAGHTATEPGIADALVRATDRFRHAMNCIAERVLAAQPCCCNLFTIRHHMGLNEETALPTSRGNP